MADVTPSDGVEGSKNADTQNLRFFRGSALGQFSGDSLDHYAASRDVQREHLRAQSRCLGCALGDGVWDVVELEIEKDPMTVTGEPFHEVRAARQKKLG